MENPTHDDDSEAVVVRAQRFELVDSKGRVRAVLGDLSAADDGFAPGLELCDRQGSARSAYALYEGGPMLDFAVDGNGVFAMGVNDDAEPDDSPRYDPVTYVSINDGDGERVLRVEVHRDSRWDLEAPVPTGGDNSDAGS